jgi:peptide/nickel transport system ATP-binding protein
MVMQDPKFSLNPVQTVGEQIAEAYRVHHKASAREAKERALAMLEAVQIRDPGASTSSIRTRSRAAWASAS